MQLEEVLAFAKEGRLQRLQGVPSLPLLRRARSFCFTQRTLPALKLDQFLS
ncbi:unnamed protein product [Hydatigera taeniaeformis]|uniref:Uncharacterized protein n=1 Tax=Hydatigena taeniaeformis TaxID=6205 RepID=A0A3P7EMZ2_HYDTA|nr:unnamed protein product [Hydatigera taeniaeformis]